MRTDTERLEWLARRGQSVKQWDNGILTLIRWSGRKNERPVTIRRQIDAAMAAEAAANKPIAPASFNTGFLRGAL